MALAFDAAAGATTANPGTSVSHSHTVSGTDRILFVGILSDSDNLTAVTYNGVSMTLAVKFQLTLAGGRFKHLYYLIAPPTGSNTLSVTAATSQLLRINSASYTGAHQTSPIDNTTTGQTGTNQTTFSLSITTVANNCWLVGTFRNNAQNLAAGSGTALRGTTNFDGIFDSDSATTPAGLDSLNITNIGPTATTWGGVMVSLAPAILSSTSPSASRSPSSSASPSRSPSASLSPSTSSSPSSSLSASVSPSSSSSASRSPSASFSASVSPSSSLSASISPSSSPSASASFSGVLRRWDGSGWVKAKLMTYTGTWENKPLKYYDGSQWAEIDVSG